MQEAIETWRKPFRIYSVKWTSKRLLYWKINRSESQVWNLKIKQTNLKDHIAKMLSDAVTRILSAGLIVIFNAATVIQLVLWIIMYPTVSCPTLSCQLLQKNVSHNLANLRVYLRLGRLSPCCVEWHHGTVSRDKLWPAFPAQSRKRWRPKTLPQCNSTYHRSSLGAKMVNRPFARDGYMVQKTPCCWKVNKAKQRSGTLKRKEY